MRNIIIVGASKGLGNSMIDGLGKTDDNFFLISRARPFNIDLPTGYRKTWIQAFRTLTISKPFRMLLTRPQLIYSFIMQAFGRKQILKN
jgi:hypothetical protein